MAKDSKKKAQPKAAIKATPKKTAPKKKPTLPLPTDLATAAPAKSKPSKAVRKAEARHLLPLELGQGGEAAILDSLWQTIENRRLSGDVSISHSARLLARGTAKVAQKLGEEAVECVIEATMGNRKATVLESADLLYHLLVVWVDAGIQPAEVWGELTRRQGISGIAEKAARPKGIIRAARTTKLP
jgi:phosphoribosyl-ATP pyrophosphohydrolase